MPGGEHRRARRARGGDADHEAGGRDDAVVRAEHRGSQPARPGGSCGPPSRGRDTGCTTGNVRYRRAGASVGRRSSDPEGTMPEAVIVATARTPIGRANKGSLDRVPPRRPVGADHRRGARRRCRSSTPRTVEDVIWGCGQPAGEAGFNIGARRRDPRRRRRSRRDRQPLLLVVAADDPHGRARDQGRRGRRVHLGRRRDRQPLRARRGRHRRPQREVRRRRARARRSAPRAARPTWTPPAGLPDVYIAMGQTAENVVEAENVSREEMDEFARAFAAARGRAPGERVLRARDHAGHHCPTARSSRRTTARAPARPSRSSRR